MTSNSSLLPSTVDVDQLEPKDKIPIKPDLVGQVVAISEFFKDMEIYKRRLVKHLDSGADLANTSFGFLDVSTSSSQTFHVREDSTLELEDSTQSPSSNDYTVEESESDGGKSTGTLKMYTCCTVCHDLKRREIQLLKEMKENERKHHKDMKRLLSNKMKENATPLSELQSVFYNEENLTVHGSANLPPTLYGERISRKLFSDEELCDYMLFPVRETGRKPLSPTRSQIFKEAVYARFPKNQDEAFRSATAAVNQLGIDLKRGRRKRK